MFILFHRLLLLCFLLAVCLTASAKESHTGQDDMYSVPPPSFPSSPSGDASRGVFGVPMHDGSNHNLPNATQPETNKTATNAPSFSSPASASPPEKISVTDPDSADSPNAWVLGLSFGIFGLFMAILATVLVYRRRQRLAKEKKRAEDLEYAKETDEDFASGDDDENKGVRFAKYEQQPKKMIERSSDLEPSTPNYESKPPLYEDPSFAVNHIEYLRKCLSSTGEGEHTDLMDPSLSSSCPQPAIVRTSIDSITSYRLPSYSEPIYTDLSMPTPRAAASGLTFYQDIFGARTGSETVPIPFASESSYTDAYDTPLATVPEESLSSRSHASRTPSPLRSKTPPRPMTPVPEYATPSSRTPSPVQAGGIGVVRSVSPTHSLDAHALPSTSSSAMHSPIHFPDSPLSQHCIDYEQMASGSSATERPRPGPLPAKPSASQGHPRPRRKVVKRGKLGPKGAAKNAASRKVSTESIALYEAMDMI